jgi:hypothetical protein
MTGDVAGARREIDAVVKQSGDAVKSEYTHIRGRSNIWPGSTPQRSHSSRRRWSRSRRVQPPTTRVLMQLGLSQFKAGDAGTRETLERALQLATKLGLHADPMQAEASAALGR